MQCVQAAVDAVAGQQLIVASDLGDAAFVDDDDAVGIAHGGEPVRDDEDRPSTHQVGERLLHDELAFRIQIRRGLVQDEDRRVLQERARDRQSLPLSA